MMDRIGRRELLMGAGAGTVALAAVGVPASAAGAETNGAEGDSLQGAWLITHIDDPSPGRPPPTSSLSVVTFAAGGALGSRDISPPGNAQFGAWAKRGEHGFVATFWDGDTSPQGPFTVKIVIHGTVSGDRLSGTFSFSVLDATGATQFSGTGTFRGTRIEAGK
jgi:hypothetical protein